MQRSINFSSIFRRKEEIKHRRPVTRQTVRRSPSGSSDAQIKFAPSDVQKLGFGGILYMLRRCLWDKS
jgi:hypothetical protein